jgi:V8-like Glu-specific endopeptidase
LNGSVTAGSCGYQGKDKKKPGTRRQAALRIKALGPDETQHHTLNLVGGIIRGNQTTKKEKESVRSDRSDERTWATLSGEGVRACAMLTTAIALTVAAVDSSSQQSDVSDSVRSARRQLAIALEAGADGRFEQDVPRKFVFAPAQLDLPRVPVANGDEVINELAVGPLLHVQGSLDAKGFLTVKSYRLRGFSRTRSNVPGPRLNDVYRAADDLFGSLETVISGKSSAVTNRTLSNSPVGSDARSKINAIVAAYRDALRAKASDEEVRAIAQEWADVRTLVSDIFSDNEFKALYGAYDNYPPWTYDVIYRQSPSVVAIGEPGSRTSLCTGVLIASDLVLTAGHCFAAPHARLPDKLEVWFDYAYRPAGTAPTIQRRRIEGVVAPPPERFASLLAGEFSAELLDYTILRIPNIDREPPIAGLAPQCLRRNTLHRGDAVYVVGYPRGEPIMIHDSARVYLPYRILDGAEFIRLRLDVEADLLSSDTRRELLRQFDSSYQSETVDGLTWRVFRNIRDSGQPRMGIVADTFQGNSGGPVYDRERDQCVVGILVAGSPDTGQRRTPNWKEHERVLPIAAILEDLAKTASGKTILERLRIQ